MNCRLFILFIMIRRELQKLALWGVGVMYDVLGLGGGRLLWEQCVTRRARPVNGLRW